MPETTECGGGGCNLPTARRKNSRRYGSVLDGWSGGRTAGNARSDPAAIRQLFAAAHGRHTLNWNEHPTNALPG